MQMKLNNYISHSLILSLTLSLMNLPVSLAQMPDMPGGNMPQGGAGAQPAGGQNMPGGGSDLQPAGGQNNQNMQGTANSPLDQNYPAPGSNGDSAKPEIKKNPQVKSLTKSNNSSSVSYVQQYQWSKSGNLIRQKGTAGNSTIKNNTATAKSSDYEVTISGSKSFKIDRVGTNSFADEINIKADQAANKLTLVLTKEGPSNLSFKHLTVSINNFVVATQDNFINSATFSVDVSGKAIANENQILIEMSGPAGLGLSYKLNAKESAPAKILTVAGPKTFTITTAKEMQFMDEINLTPEQLADKITLTLTKEGPDTNKFKTLAVSLGGYIVATEKNFEKANTFSVDLTKKITSEHTQMLISASGPDRTAINYKITVPQTTQMREEQSDKLPFVIQEGKEYTATNALVNKYSETFDLKPGEEHLPLYLTLNTSGPGNGFSRLLVYLNGVAVASKQQFKKNTLSLNVINQLIPGNNEIAVQSQGPKDSKFSWKLTCPKIVVKSTKPEPCAMGDEIMIMGDNFPIFKKPNLKYGYVEEVTIDNLAAIVTYATKNQLKVLVPDTLKPGESKLQVKVGRVKSKEQKINIKADPVAFGVDHINIQPLGILNIKGKGFSNNSSKIKVKMRGQDAKVMSASATNISIQIPESLDLISPTASAMDAADQGNAMSEPAQGGFTNIEITSDGVKAKYQPKQDCFPGITQPSSLGVGIFMRVIGPSNQVNMP